MTTVEAPERAHTIQPTQKTLEAVATAVTCPVAVKGEVAL